MLSFAGSQRTRCAQTPLALDPANLPLLGGSQAQESQLQNQKQKQNQLQKQNLSRAGALQQKPDLGFDKNCGSRPADDAFRPDWQENIVYEPRKAAEGTERIGKH